MESPYVNINGQKLEEQTKPDASLLRKRVRQNLFFSLHKQNLGNFEWKILQHFAKLNSWQLFGCLRFLVGDLKKPDYL